MLDFYVVTNCPGKGLYRNSKRAKREYQKEPEAIIKKFQSPKDIDAAQAYCAESGITVKKDDWEDLLTAGRLSEYARNGRLDAPPADTINKPAAASRSTDLPLDADVVIFTDGSYMEYETKVNEKVISGGYAAILILRNLCDAEISISGHMADAADPGYMELTAINKALKHLLKYNVTGKVILYTDAQSVANDYNQKAAGWAECGWVKPDGDHIKHWKVWRKIWKKTKQFPAFQMHWIKGHSKNKYNNRCHLTAYAEALLGKDTRREAVADSPAGEGSGPC